MRSPYAGAFLAAHRNIFLVGGTGTPKTHLAIPITANVVCTGACGRYTLQYFRSGDRLIANARKGRSGILADKLASFDGVVLGELDYLPYAKYGG